MRIAVMPRAAVLAAVLALGGCGSSSDPTPAASPSSSPAGVIEGSMTVPARGFTSLPLATTRAGTLTVRLTLSRNIVVAGIVTSACAAGTRSGCITLSYTEASNSDSSKTLTAPGAGAGGYVVIFGNVGAAAQSVSYSISLTS